LLFGSETWTLGKNEERVVNALIYQQTNEHLISHKTLLTFWRGIFFFNFSTPVYKMCIKQEPNTLEL